MPIASVVDPGTLKDRKIDVKDKRIIDALLQDSRMPCSKVAKLLGYSQEVVKYRLARLVEDNIITDFFAVVDSSRLGIMRFNIYLQFSTLSRQDERQVVEYLLAQPFVSWAISTSGKWDFMIQLSVRSLQDVDIFLLDLSKQFLDLLKSYECNIIVQFHHLPQRFLTVDVGKNASSARSTSGPYAKELRIVEAEAPEVDATDMRLLKILENDARTSLIDIAKNLGCSKDTVNYRIKRLIRQKIITKFMLRLNWHALGYEYHSILVKLKNSDSRTRSRLIAYLSQKSEVIAVFVQIGFWNLCIQSVVKNALALKELEAEIREHFKDTIEDTDTALYFNQYYFTYLPDGVMKSPR